MQYAKASAVWHLLAQPSSTNLFPGNYSSELHVIRTTLLCMLLDIATVATCTANKASQALHGPCAGHGHSANSPFAELHHMLPAEMCSIDLLHSFLHFLGLPVKFLSRLTVFYIQV